MRKSETIIVKQKFGQFNLRYIFDWPFLFKHTKLC